jgi:hypothetical protein
MSKKSGVIIVSLLILVIVVLAGFLLNDYISTSIADRSEGELTDDEDISGSEYTAANAPGTITPKPNEPEKTTPPPTESKSPENAGSSSPPSSDSSSPPTTESTNPPPSGSTDSPLPPPGGGSVGTAFSFSFNPKSGPVESEVILSLSEPRDVDVYYIEPSVGQDGRQLLVKASDKKVFGGDKNITVLIPGNALDGFFELRWNGGKVRASEIFIVTIPFNFTFNPKSGPTGTEVKIYLSEPKKNLSVYYNNSPLAKVTSADGKTLTVHIPANEKSGYFELFWDGGRLKATEQFSVFSLSLPAFTYSPKTGPAGTEVKLYLSEPKPNIHVYFNNSPLAKITSADGKTLTVYIPANESSGYFEIFWDGGSYKDPNIFTVTK